MAKLDLPIDSEMQEGVKDKVFDARSLLIGGIIALALAGGAAVWRVAVVTGVLKGPEEFKFGLAEHATDKLDLKDPLRDFVKERVVDSTDLPPTEVIREERPNIQITDKLPTTDVVSQTEVIKSRNVDMATSKIDVAGVGSVTDTPDAPIEISQTSDSVSWALNVIAAETGGPADIFKYKDPTPHDKHATGFVNAAPRAGRPSTLLPQAFGDQDAPTIGKLGPVAINLFGTGEYFRTGDRSGFIGARSAVDSALRWLALHQSQDGSWDTAKYDGGEGGKLASTGLACLAFLGGGNTTAKGEYRRNVLRGVEYIMKQQNDKGLITQPGANLYTHSICTIALCEAYGRAKDERILAAAQKAIDYCQLAVATDGGWRYGANPPASDTSVTAWFVQALKTAKMAGVPFKSQILSRSLVFLDSVTDDNAGNNTTGVVRYMAGNEGHVSPALTSAAMLIRQVTGTGVRAPVLAKGAELTRRTPPDWRQKNFYYWYYATYAMHNMGGEHRIWWNARMRDVLLEHQAKDGDNAGSWDPKGDQWGGQGGRVYCTALGALCLEVYYRYSGALETFQAAPDLDDIFLEKRN